VIIAAAPHLHGLPLSVLEQAVETVLAHDDTITLPAVTGCRQGAGVGSTLCARRRGAHCRVGREAQG
jgi:hypothetical protein